MSATTSPVRPLLALSVLARLPLAMLSIGWLVHVERLTGSFATAGLVAGTLAIAQGVGGPLLGRIADRRGQTAVLAGAALGAGGALVAGAMLAVATLAFAAAPASRAWRPQAAAARPAGDALRAPGMRTLVLVLAGVGVLFGSFEVATAAAAEALGQTAAAGPLLGLWGLGSLAGGIAAARAGGAARTGAGLVLLLGGLAAGHLLLAAAAGSLVALAAATVLAGVLIALTLATPLAMVDAVAPAGTQTEALAWLA